MALHPKKLLSVCSCLFLLTFLSPELNGQTKMQGSAITDPVSLDSNSVDLLNERSEACISRFNKDSAFYYAGLALAQSTSIHYLHGMAKALSLQSRIERLFNGNFMLSEQLAKKSLAYYEKSGNKNGLSALYFDLWSISMSESKFDEAADYGQRAYDEALKAKNQDEIFTSLSDIFLLYKQTGNYERGFEYAEQLYDIAEKSENKFWVSSALWNLGQLYTLVGDYPVAMQYYQRVWKLGDAEIRREREKNDSQFRLEMEFAELLCLSKQFDSAWKYYYLFNPDTEPHKSYFLLSTGECFFLQGYFRKALYNFQVSLDSFQKRNDMNNRSRALFDVAKTYLVLDSPLKALDYSRQCLAIALGTKSSPFIRDNYKIISEVYDQLHRFDSSDFYFRKYIIVRDVVLDDQEKGKMAAYGFKQRIVLMNQEKEIQAFRLQKEMLWKNVLIAGIVILLLFSFLIFRSLLYKRRLDSRLRALAENELKIQKLESEKSTAEFLFEKSELEMNALRAQMNPHFIFNCLNSINHFIIGNDARRAADYLTKFAKLIRIVLEKSGSPFIPLQEELFCLRLYLELEALRFHIPFHFEIHCDGIDLNRVMVPSMLIQPFVENAIWHGLSRREGDPGHILINLHREQDFVVCEIRDNGIGLAASAEKKSEAARDKKSLGIEITKKRLNLAGTPQDDGLNVSFQDLKDEKGLATGTSVLIRIPVKNSDWDV
jgi:hypothetical protein